MIAFKKTFKSLMERSDVCEIGGSEGKVREEILRSACAVAVVKS